MKEGIRLNSGIPKPYYDVLFEKSQITLGNYPQLLGESYRILEI